MRLSILLLSSILLFLLHENSLQKLFVTFSNSTDLVLVSNSQVRYNCEYSKLWCGCYSKSGGCQVGCYSSKTQLLRNVTSCPTMQKYILSGFTQI